MAHVVLDGRLADRGRVALAAGAQELRVAPQVAPVRGARVGGEAALDREPIGVLGE